MKNNKLVLGLAIALAIMLWLFFMKPDIVKEVVTTVVKYDTITKTVDNTKPTEIKKVTIRLTDTIFVNDTIRKVVFKDKIVSQYKYKDSLENGVVEATILADTIYKRDIKLTVFNKTTTTEIVRTVVQSKFYVGSNMQFDKANGMTFASANLYYTHKNKWMVGAGYGYNFQFEKPQFSITLAIPLSK